jgi:hypothetical protein
MGMEYKEESISRSEMYENTSSEQDWIWRSNPPQALQIAGFAGEQAKR